MFHIPSCFDTSNGSVENFNECLEVIYNNYSDIEDVDLSSHTLNHHDQSQIILENEEKLNSKIVTTSSHFQTINHTHGFNIQEPIPIYDFYDDTILTSIHNPNPLSNSRIGIGDHSESIILANYCKEEITSNQSQLCCNNSVNYDLISLLFLHLFCSILDLFFVSIFQFLDILC